MNTSLTEAIFQALSATVTRTWPVKCWLPCRR